MSGISGLLAANDTIIIKAVGTWGYFSNYPKHEEPFWNQHIADVSGGDIVGEIKPQDELGLRGFEIMRLLKSGVFDFAFGLPAYAMQESEIFEGADLSSLVQNIAVQKKVAAAYFPTLERAFTEKYNAKLMMLYPFPSQMIWCKKPVNSIEDLKGKRIRVFLTTLGDFVEGVGAIPVSVAYHDVPNALANDRVDCVITGTMSAYTAQLYKLTPYGFTLRVGWGLAFGAININKWNRLSEPQKKLLQQEISILTENMWRETATEDAIALACLSAGPCSLGETGNMVLVEPSKSDLLIRDKIATEVILPRWAQRCGPECASNWNRTVGKILHLRAGN
ncbi:TRAP transporter substrate-binding protein [Neptunomonas antarctica]|uniref:TRAP-type C4-dicarboxylate transport system, substrate-binding protein n=1 Tax=Neptunomonas antarctica TaxID=619304 RepID=A0A1N7KWA7_9GAMM|nr:TRAP transporter substrate-binding protein [Neptunomonas antarctica]SIS65875.1 TRAP-type C4-dicarboxylate transport system, substrate-binding protein [Neptunomonas antarctica]